MRIEKELTIDDRWKLIAASKKLFKEYAKRHPEMDAEEVKTLMLMDPVRAAQEIGKWKDRWVSHPQPTMSEPNKASRMLTDLKKGEKKKTPAMRLRLADRVMTYEVILDFTAG